MSKKQDEQHQHVKSVLKFRSGIQKTIVRGLDSGLEPNAMALFGMQVITQMAFVLNKNPKRARDVMMQALQVNLEGAQKMPIRKTRKWILKG